MPSQMNSSKDSMAMATPGNSQDYCRRKTLSHSSAKCSLKSNLRSKTFYSVLMSLSVLMISSWVLGVVNA